MSTLSWNISDVKELNTSDVGKCASKRWQCSTTQLHVNVAYSMQISDNQHASKWTIQIFKSPGKNVKNVQILHLKYEGLYLNKFYPPPQKKKEIILK